MFRPIFYVLLSTYSLFILNPFTVINSVNESNTIDKEYRANMLPPNLVCRNYNLSVSGNNTVIINKDSLISSVSTGATITVRKMTVKCSASDTVFGNSISVCNADLGDTIRVIVKAVLGSDSNTCMAFIIASDKLPPTLSNILPDVMVSCSFKIDTSKLDTFGRFLTNASLVRSYNYLGTTYSDGFVEDFSNPIAIKHTYIDQRNACGLGTITRNYTISDRFGNTTTDQQIINVANPAPLGTNNINWPNDTTIIVNCLKPPYARNIGVLPTINTSGVSCSMTNISHSDMIFAEPNSGCLAIMRTWRVIDMCNNNQVFQRVQNIFLRDTVKPTPVAGSLSSIGYIDSSGACQYPFTHTFDANDNCTNKKDLAFSWSIDSVNSNGSINLAKGLGNSFTRTYTSTSNKEYIVTWTVDDRCGNIMEFVQNFKTKEGKAPSPILNSKIILSLPKACDVTVKAKDLNKASYDNCSPANRLRYSFSTNPNDSTKVFKCANLGNNVVNIYVWDTVGNSAFVPVQIEVQDPEKHCSTTRLLEIAGVVSVENDLGLSDVKINMQGAEQERAVMTNQEGKFSLSNLESGSFYEVQAEKEGLFNEEVNVLDLLEIQKHILGTKKLTSNAKLIAADVNQDEQVNIKDLVSLRKYIMGVDEYTGPSWQVVSKASLQAERPWPIEKMVRIPALEENVKLELEAVKIGDINGTFSQKLRQRNKSAIQIYSLDQTFEGGMIIKLPVRINDVLDLNALQLELNYNSENLYLRGIESGALNLDFDETNSAIPGKIIVTKTDVSGLSTIRGSELFTLVFEARNRGKIADNINGLTPELEGLASTTNGEIWNVSFNTLADQQSILSVGQNIPNPFDQYTDLAFEIQDKMPVEITVVDASGKSVYKSYKEYEKGKNTISFSDEHFKGQTGLFIVHIECAEVSITRKMLRIK